MTNKISAPTLSFDAVSNDAWDNLVAQSEQGSVFNSREFLSALGVDIRYWGVYDGYELMAATSVQVDGGGNPVGPDKCINLYQGIMLSPAITGLPVPSRVRRELAVVNRLIEGLTERYDEIWLSMHPRMKDIRSLQWFNYHTPENGQFQIDVRYTGLLELTNFSSREELVSSFARGRQGDYKKAISKGITVKTCFDPNLLDTLHAKTFARQEADRGVFDKLLIPITDAALKKGFGELLVAYTDDGAPTSASLFIWDNSTAHYLFGASDPEYRNTGAATYVLAESLWRAIERKNCRADFVGVNSPQRGEFKTSFGALPVTYFEAHWKVV